MSQSTRDRLLKVTRNLIDETGVQSVTLRGVGSSAGLSRSAVYRHFKDKETLLAEIVTENFKLLLNLFDKITAKKRGPKDILKDLLMQFYVFGISHKEHYQLMFGTDWNKEKFPQLHHNALKVFNKTRDIVELSLKKGIDRKSSLKNTAVLVSFIHGLVELHLSGHFESVKGLNKTDQLIKHMLVLLINQ